MRRLDPATLVAAVLAVAGLALLLVGLEDGVPLVFFGTPEERAAAEAGRRLSAAAALVLLAAAALLAARGKWVHAGVVAAAGLLPASLAYAASETAFAWLAFLPLAPAAIVAVALAVRRSV